MSFAPKQFIRSVDFLSTENAINTSTGCVNIYGGMSVSKDSYLTNVIVVGNTTITNLNITGTLTTSNGNNLISSQWTSVDSNTDVYFGTSANAFVGIGTTTPGFNLDISGGSRITGGLTVGNLNVNTGATITNILNTTICTGTIILTTGTLNASFNSNTIGSVVTTGGNVGIGINTPETRLSISTNSASVPLRLRSQAASTALTGVQFSLADTSVSTDSYVKGAILYNVISTPGAARGNMFFCLNNASNSTNVSLSDARMTILDTGNVGIATTAPANTLDVSGTARITTSLTTGSLFSTNVTSTNIVGTNVTASNLRVSGTINSGDVTVGNINFTGSLFQNGSAYLGSQWTTTSGNTLTYTSGSVTINSGFSSTFNSNTLGNIFTTGGNVGIGTTSPASRLHLVNPTTLNTNNMVFEVGTTADGINAGWSAINWNGYYNSGEQRINTGKNRWRLFIDQRTTTDGLVFDTYNGTTLTTILSMSSSGNVNISNTANITTISSGNILATNITVSNMNSTTNTIGTLNATGVTTTSLLATNSVLTNVSVTNMNSSTNTIGTLNATGVTTASLLATSASIGNISAGTINLSSNMNIAGTLTVVNVTTTNLTMSNGNALLNLVTSGSIVNTGLISTANLISTNITVNSIIVTGSSLNATFNSNTIGSIFTTGGNIGIGSVTPAYKLDVSGDIRSNSLIVNGGGTYTTGSIYRDAGWGMLFRSGTNNPIAAHFSFADFNDNKLLHISSTNGNVGIGSVTPIYKLDVNGDARFNTIIISNQVSPTVTRGSIISNPNWGMYFQSNNAAPALGHYTFTDHIGNGLLTINASGVVTASAFIASTGITSASLLVTGLISTSTLSSTNQTTTNVVSTNTTLGTLNATGIVNLLSTTGIQNSTNNYSTTSGALNVSGDAVIGSELYFLNTTVSPPTMNGRGTGSKIVLFPETGVGLGDYAIGIESANMWFQVPNAARGFKFYQGTTANLVITGGNMGINTASPAAPLHVSNNTGNTMRLQNVSSFSNACLELQNDNSISYIGLGSSAYGGALQNNLFLQSPKSTVFNINGNTTAMFMNTSGNVGIGTITPAYRLDINGTTRITNTSATSMGTLIVAGPNSSAPATATSGQLASFYGAGGAGAISNIDLSSYLPTSAAMNLPSVRFSMKDLGFNNSDLNILTKNPGITGTMASRIFIDGSGNAGIANTAPGYTLDVNGTFDVSNANGYMLFASSGNLGIRTTSPSGMLHLNNAALFTSTGNLTCTGDVVSFGNLSDIRLKKNIKTIETAKALDIVSKLRAVSFDWKEDIFNEQKRNTSDLGFIAQEVEELIPEAVSEYTQIESGEVYKNIKHERLVPYLLSTIQYLLNQVEELKHNI